MRKLQILMTLLWAYVLTMHAQTVQYLPLYTDATFSNKTIDLDLPVGHTEGAINVSPTGGASYTIPIALPPGTKGVVPSVSVVYNSQGGNGMMGMGWNIAGLSAISRTGKNMHYDSQVSPVKLNYEDFFALDGNRLEWDAATNSYRTKMETFSKVTLLGSNPTSPDGFKVETKSGMIYEYGNTSDSKYRDENNTVTISWQINKMSDQYGNYVEYVYEMNGRELRIKEIKYTGSAAFLPYNKIVFSYANREDNSKFYIAGVTVEQKSLLTSMMISTDDQIVKSYNFSYAKDYNYSYLREVSESGSNGTSLNSTIFKYGNEVPISNNLTEEEITTGVSLEGPTDFFTGDINGDGYTDIIQAPYTLKDGIKFHSKFKVFIRNTVTNTFTLSYSEILPAQTYIETKRTNNGKNFSLADFNGDGRDDIAILSIYSTDAVWWSFVNLNIKIYYSNSNGTSFEQIVHFDESIGSLSSSSSSSSSNLVPRNIYTQGDFDGDGRIDIIVSHNSFSGQWLSLVSPSLGTKKTISINSNSTPTALQICNAERLIPIDFDGDGKMEILVQRSPFNDVISFNKVNDEIVAEKLWYSGPVSVFPNKIFIGDFNGDKKTDFLTLASDNLWYTYYSNGKDQFIITPFSSNANLKDVVVADFDGDGLSDICNNNNSDSAVPFFPKFDIYYSRGTNSPYLVSSYTSSNFWMGDLNSVVGDFNGDGKSDLFVPAWRLFYFSPNVNSKYRLLNKVKNGFGQTSEIAYKALTEGGNFYTKNTSSNYPLNVLSIPIYATSSVTVPNGIGGTIATTYKYENAKVHRGGLGFLGFTTYVSLIIFSEKKIWNL